MICDEAHTALGEKTSRGDPQLPEPIYIGMTATEQLIAKQVSDVFPASVDDLPLADAARRGLIAPLRCLRVPPVAAINSVPIVGGDFEERALAEALDHEALNRRPRPSTASASTTRRGSSTRPASTTPTTSRRSSAPRASRPRPSRGRTPPVKLAEILAAYERGEINVLINAMLLAEGWNSPRATVCMHLAPTASKRVYQQRIGRIMRMHPRKEAGIVVDFVAEGRDAQRPRRLAALAARRGLLPRGRAGHARRRGGASQRRAPAQADAGDWLVPVTPDVAPAARRDPARVAAHRPAVPRRRRAAVLGDDRRAARSASTSAQTFVQKFTEQGASKGALEQFLATCAAREPEPAAAA